MGTYAESLLTPDERVLRRERQHWISLIFDSWIAIILWGITIVLILASIFLPEEFMGRNIFGDDTLLGSVGMAATLVTLLLGIVVVAKNWWEWRVQEFLVTNRRLVLAFGVINKTASDSSLEKINDAQLEVSWLGRILDYGHLDVLTAAPIQGADMLHWLHHAKAFKKAMMTAKHELQSEGVGDGESYPSRPAPAPAQAPASSARIDVSGSDDPIRADTPDEVAAVLGQLSKLRDAGSISDEEYEAKKAELLARL